jgi:hypothetical protein
MLTVIPFATEGGKSLQRLLPLTLRWNGLAYSNLASDAIRNA